MKVIRDLYFVGETIEEARKSQHFDEYYSAEAYAETEGGKVFVAPAIVDLSRMELAFD